MGDLEVAGRLFDSFSESNGGSREPSAHGGREFMSPTPDRLLEGAAQRLKGMLSSGIGDSPRQQLQQSTRRTAASGAPQGGPGSSPEVAVRGSGATHSVSSPRDLPLRHSPGSVPDAGEGTAMASSGGSRNIPAPQAHLRHEPHAAASACLAGDRDTAPQQLPHPSGSAATASSQAGAAPPLLIYRDGSGASGGGLGQLSHGEGSSSVSSLSSLGQGAYTQSSPAHRGHPHPAMRRQQAPSSAGHLLEVASASSVGTPSSRQVGRAPDSGAIPRSVFFDFALGSGAAPGPRWGHTATAVGDRLWIYGGMGTRVFSDLHVYSPGSSTWRSATGTALNKKDIPGEMFGHAACAAGSRLLVFGGRQGRKFLRSLYILDTGTLEWQRQKEPPGAPPALANHTFTAVGQHGAYCFGGQGKRTFNSVHKLDPVTLAWEEVKTLGTAPEPRHGHSSIWDESDSLIVFGGAHGSHCLADVHVLSLSTGFWSRPTCRGTAPNPRSNHSAALISPTLMLVFGGCSAAGAFMNDVHVLDIATFTWHQPGVVGPAPAARYGHACQVLDGRVVILGGSNAAKAFDGVLTVCTDFGSELNTVADELAGMMAARQQQQQQHGAVRPPVPASSTSPSAGQAPGPSGSPNAGVRAQLSALLQRRHAQEQQVSAARKADVAEGLFNEERRRAEALQAEVAHLQLMQQEAATAHMEQVAGLQQQAELEGRQRWEEAEARALAQQRLKATQEELQQALDASSRNACFKDRCQALERVLEQRRGTQQRLEAALRLAETNSNDLRNQLQISDSTAATLREDLKRLTPPAMRDAAVQVVLAHDPTSTPDSPHDLSPLPQQSSQQMLRSITSQQSLAGHSLSDLQLLDSSLGQASREVRSTLASRVEAELHNRSEALKAAQHAVEELQHGCALCMEHPKQVALNCGHQTCQLCSGPLEECPFCRVPVTMKLILF